MLEKTQWDKNHTQEKKSQKGKRVQDIHIINNSQIITSGVFKS